MCVCEYVCINASISSPRYCCLYSTVEIPSRSKSEGRIEVRVMPEAVAEVNARFRALILHKFQSDLLLSSSSRVYMYGVMGSGKSVMLTLRARYWLAQGCNVVIINVSYDVEGSPIGYALLHAVNERLDASNINKEVSFPSGYVCGRSLKTIYKIFGVGYVLCVMTLLGSTIFSWRRLLETQCL